MKKNEMKTAMDKRLVTTRWSDTNTRQVLERIRSEQQPVRRRITAVVSVAMILLLIAAVTALAESGWGLMQWFSGGNLTAAIPTAKPEIILQADCPYATFQLTEAASDGYGMYINVLCIPKASNILLLNASVDPNETTVREIGIDSDEPLMTVGSWAEENGYTSLCYMLLYSGHRMNEENLMQWDPATFFSGSNSTMQLNDDGSCNILISGTDLGNGYEYELSCWCVPYIQGKDKIWEVESARPDDYTTLRFSVPEEQKQPNRIIARYLPSAAPADGYMMIKETEVVSSLFSTYVVTEYTLTEKGKENANSFDPPMFCLSEPESLTANHLIRNRTMQGRRIVSTGDEPVYQYFYSCSLPETLPDVIHLSAFASERETVEGGFRYKETSYSEETKMIRMPSHNE